MRMSGAAALQAVLRDTGRAVLANRRLRRVAETWGLWVVGEWAFLVLLSVTAYDRGGTTAVAVVGAVRMVPAAVAAPLLSLAADRMSRVHVLVAILLSWMLLVAAVPAGLLPDSLLPMYLLVGAASVTSTLLRPAINALIPQVVDRPDELTAGNSTYSIVEAAGSLVGPLIAGALVATAGTTARYLTVAVIFGLAAGISATIRTEFKPADHQDRSGWRRVLEPLAGFPALVGPPRLRSVFIVFMAQSTTRGLLNVLVVALAVSLPGTDLSSTGLFFAALGAGGVVGGVITFVGTGWRPGLPFVIGMSMWGLPLIVIAAHPTPIVAWLAIAAVGLGNALGDVYGFTLVHRLIPDHLLGRAFGAFWGTASAAQALGAAIAAPLIAGLGLRATLLTVGIVMALIPLLSWYSVRRINADLRVDEREVAVLRRCTLLAPLTRVALEQLSRRAIARTVATGSVVIEQGTTGEAFFVVDSGELDARVDGATVRRLGPGDCFGEIAALNHTPRTATVVARQACRLLTLDGTDFVLAVTGHRPAERAALDMARERIERRGTVAPESASEDGP
jgi:MFS family permease